MPTFAQGLASSLDLPRIAQTIIKQIEEEKALKVAEEEKQRKIAEQKQQQEAVSKGIQDIARGTTMQEGKFTMQPSQQAWSLNNTPVEIPPATIPGIPKQAFQPTEIPLTKTPPWQSGLGYTGAEQEVPVDKMQKALELSNIPGGSAALNNYLNLQKQFAPEKKKYREFGGNLYEEDPTTGEISPQPIMRKKKEVVYDKSSKYALEVDDAGIRKPLKDVNGNLVANPTYDPPEIYLDDKFNKSLGKFEMMKGVEDPNGDYTKNGVKYRITQRTPIAPVKKAKDGQTYISKAAKNMFSEYYKQQQKLKAEYNAMQSGQPLLDEYGGFKTRKIKVPDPDNKDDRQYDLTKDVPVTASDIGAASASLNARYVNAVKSGMPEDLKSWYKELYNQEDPQRGKKKGNPTSKDFWLNLINSWKQGQLSPADVNYGVELYRATYADDPVTRYGFKMSDIEEVEEEEE